MIRARVFVVALALLSLVAANTLHCYYPDGTNADGGTSPCNTTASVSACCDPRDSCTMSGLCLGASGWIYRSSCTDQTWSSSACPSQCHNDPVLNSPYSSFAPIFPCAAGIGSSQFCCGSYSNQDCCGSNFTLGNTGLAFKPGNDAVLAQLSSLSAAVASTTASSSSSSSTPAPTTTVTVTATATATATSTSSSNLGTAVGAGVGVPLGVLAIGLLAFLIWRERRHRRERASVAPESNAGWAQGNTMSSGYAGASSEYGGGNPAPMSQHGGVQPPYTGQSAMQQGQPGWKDPNTLSSVDAYGQPTEARHELHQ